MRTSLALVLILQLGSLAPTDAWDNGLAITPGHASAHDDADREQARARLKSDDPPTPLAGQTLPRPAEHACLAGGPGSHLPFCDAGLPTPDRVKDLLGRLNMSEKAGLMGAGTTSCAFMDAGVARLGIPVYTWCVEANTGAGGICLAPGRCQSTFPSPTGIAASFNRSSWHMKGEVVSWAQDFGVRTFAKKCSADREKKINTLNKQSYWRMM